MPTTVPVATKVSGDIFSLAMWNNQLRDNLNKLLNTGHRSLTVAQFSALSGLEGTAGTVAGDEVYLIVDATNGVLWHLVYESGEATYKWRCIGGSNMISEVTTSESTTSTSYVDLTTVLSLTAPRGGDYEITHGARLSSGGVNGIQPDATVKLGAAAAAGAEGISSYCGAGAPTVASGAKLLRRTLAASDVVKHQYKTSSGTAFFDNRFVALKPARLV